MRIEAITNNAYTELRPQTKAAERPDVASFATALTNAMNGSADNNSTTDTNKTGNINSTNSANNNTASKGFVQPDFTNMSVQELRDWTNQQLRDGNMTLDESIPFMLMSMNTPVDGSAENTSERFDYTQKVRDGIERALADNNMETLKMLQSSMKTMQRYQGHTSGIDTQA